MSSGGEKHWRLLDNLSGKTPTVNKSVESNKSLKRKRADGAAPRDRRGRARVFAPAASLSSNDRDLLVWLDAELRAGRVSVSSFCRRLSLDRHNLSNLLTGWKRTMSEEVRETLLSERAMRSGVATESDVNFGQSVAASA